MKPSSSSKTISSPGRALVEKFPPPLMTFLRSNVCSKSTRGKSKAKSIARTKPSPLFFRKKKPTGAGDTQEPSSPKVTCIGQVRVRRSKNAHSRSRPTAEKTANCCRCGRRRFLCFPVIISTKGLRLECRKWVRWFGCRSAKAPTGSSRTGANPVEEEDGGSRAEIEERGSGKEMEESGVASESTPPKDALLLTRCRSAPYRSSSLACRLWGAEDERENKALKFTEEREREGTGTVSAASGTEAGYDAGGGGRRDSESELAGIRSEIGGESQKKEEEEKKKPPIMVLMRCRSEPVRRGSEKLDPLTSEFWRERRLSDTG